MTKISVLDQGYVELIESWGSDERIVESARMSTDKGFKGWPEDEKLLRFLWENKHLTPFEMGGLIIEVQAPIFVFREWHRHRTQSFNELSARYTALPDMYYIPSVERLMNGKQASKNKQSSEAGFSEEQAVMLQADLKGSYIHSRAIYDFLLEQGVAREIARIIVPVGQYSRMRASANLRNWLAFLTLRQAPGAQFEIRQFANAVGQIVAEQFPRTHKLFNES